MEGDEVEKGRLVAALVAMHALLSARGGNLAGHDAADIAKRE